MGRYKCDKCTYETDRQHDFQNHLNRKIPCHLSNAKNKSSGNSKRNTKIPHCKLCNKDFSRLDSLTRHNKKYHTNIKGNKNQIIQGDNNNQTFIETQNNIVIQPIIIYPYNHNDVNDLTLFEQYLAISSEESPHSALIDHLNLNPEKPSYHNIHLSNLNKNIVDVHNGEKWIKEIMTNAISSLIDTKTDLIKKIFNKFRCFLSNKAMYHIPRYYHYYGFKEHSQTYKKLIQQIKVHLYNNRDNGEKPKENIPTDRNNKIYWALSKQFTWPEVDNLITKMDEFDIDYNQNLDEIKQQLLVIIDDKPKLFKFFKKFLKRLNYLIDEFKINEDSDTSPTTSDNGDTDDDSE
ncbi:hypothetical protein QJ857_gp0398 [Tupanvirus soda lake]|uniref:C2H2-type domain-containing protein n=2 Tax=Tupanvirus TaxID=2094720 RepID=A0A6N1NW80_9VIRU|nr:hypothetical protein QJ857_gp0398 [Tupanvirus soda lake]QKU35636.1 hypothetical protein [Tupanvirus soda lake]